MKYCFKVGLYRRGLLHDLSKFSPTEFIPGVKYFQGNRSPNEKEREILGYSRAWLHHKGRNRHHFEYWFDVSPLSRKYEPVEMPPVFLAEMFCDRLAASHVYKKEKYRDSDPYDYFLFVKSRDLMHPKTEAMLEKWLKLLIDIGEEETLRTVREYLKESKRNKKEKA